MQLTLVQFERIDGLMASLLRMGEFETCADPRGYAHTSNVLYDALIDTFGLAFTEHFASALECAAHVVAAALLGTVEVLDELAA